MSFLPLIIISLQAENLKVCNIDDALLARLKKFRFRKEKTNEAIVMVIDSSTMTIHEDTSFDTDELVVRTPSASSYVTQMCVFY
jgi:hypothetical protein